MSGILTTIIALLAAGGLAWLVRRYEASRIIAPTQCSREVDAVFAKSTNDTADSVLLKELMVHRDRCLGDAVFVDQARRLLVQSGRAGEARALLETAESRHAMKLDEFKAQHAWVDAAESHQQWADGNEAAAQQLYDRAKTSAEALRAKWPEWSLPYLILSEVHRSGISPTRDDMTVDYFRDQQAAQSNKWNGAWVRSLAEWRPMLFTFLISAAAFLALGMGLSGLVAARFMTRTPTSSISAVSKGYVELKGKLERRSEGSGVIGTLTHSDALWYELQYNSGMKKARTQYSRSGTPFVLRDASGYVVIDLDKMEVQTRHSFTRFGNAAGQMNGSRSTELLLKEGDPAFALGDIYEKTNADGKAEKHLRVAADGRRLFVSNYSESELIWMEKAWFTAGTVIASILLLLLIWAGYQRYFVQVAPGIL